MYRLTFICITFTGLLIASAFAQDRQPAGSPETGARDSDLKSIDSVIIALYDVISGPAGERDWKRMRNLFIEDAHMGSTGTRRDGTSILNNFGVEGYIERSGPFFLKNAFYETELTRKLEVFGPIAHAFSTYESRRDPDDAPFARGINSIQLAHAGGKWRIVSIFWTSETDDNPIPEAYLP